MVAKTPTPLSASRLSYLMICREVAESRPLVGSSSSSTYGSAINS